MAFFFLLFLTSLFAWAEPLGLCDIIKSARCDGVTKQIRRSSSLSLPSPAAAANMNPAAVSFDRGFGIEAIHQAGNPIVFNLASGTGKMGGALISNSLENSFFGNRVPELSYEYFDRREDKKQYKPKKLNLALGAKLLRRRNITLDFGLIFKRHSEIKRINPGAGISGRIGPINLGASIYQDDLYLRPDYTPDSYTERFIVKTFSIGSKFRNITFDAGLIQTKYKLYEDETKISLYSMGFYYKNLLFNLGIRNEHSPDPKYVDGELKNERRKNETYAGLQCSLGKHLILGAQYNYFLLREISFTGTLFF